MLKIGYLTEFIVTRANPDYEAYLVLLAASGLPALLPKKYSAKPYRIGETGWACIFDMDKTYTIISQRSPQYTRKILEYLIREELEATNLRIYRVAKTESGVQYKVALKGAGEALDLYAKIRHLKEKIQGYIYGNVYFIKHAPDMTQYIKNALLPAPSDQIRKVILRKDINQADVYVDTAVAAMFFGKKGNNVASASKLTGMAIRIITI